MIVWADHATTVQLAGGGPLCLFSRDTGARICDYDAVSFFADRNGESWDVECPEPRPPSPDMTNSLTVNIRANDGNSPENCNYLAYQIGCEDGNFCAGKGYDGVVENINNFNIPYPMLSPLPRLRFRMVGVGRTQWTVNFRSNNAIQFWYTSYMPQGNWFEVPMTTDFARVEILASCFSS